MKYAPLVIGAFFLDGIDFEGILYWYELILEVSKNIENSKQKK